MFGATLPMTRLAVAEFEVISMTAVRGVVGGLAAACVLLATRRKFPPAHLWPRIAYVAATVGIGFQFCSAMGSLSVPSAHGGVVLGLLPLITALTATLWSGERPSAGFWACSIAGAALVIAYALRQGGGGISLGDLWLVGSVLCAATGYVFSAELARVMPGWVVISWALAGTLVITVPLSILFWPDYLARITPRGWTAFAYLSLCSQYLGFFAWNAGLAMGGTARVSQIQLLQTFITIGLAALIAGERIDLETVLCAVAVVGLVVLSRRFRVVRA